MRFYSHERMALLVDAHTTAMAADKLGLDIDWGKLELFFGRHATLAASVFFTSHRRHGDGFEPMRQLLDWLETNGWLVIERPGLVDVDMAVTAMDMAAGIGHFVLGTANPTFIPLVEALQRKGTRVTILSTVQGHVASPDLRRAANDFLDLNSMRDEIARAPKKQAVSA